MISSSDNHQIKFLRQLATQAKARRNACQTVLEGIHLLTAALNAAVSPLKVFVPQYRLNHPEVTNCLTRIPSQKIEIIADKVTAKLASFSAGTDVLSVIDIPAELPLAKQQDCVILENIQDPGNLGTILRSAAAAGIVHIALSKCCADAWAPKVLRAAMGAHFVLNIVQSVELTEFVQNFSGSLNMTSLLGQNLKNLYELDLHPPCAWVFGNEGVGISPGLAAYADYGVKIPMSANTESLNVAMAATICLFEQMRQRREQ